MLLSFDTSLSVLSVAIVDEGIPLGSLIVESAGSRNEKLLPAVDWLLSEVGRRLDDVDALVVTRGPGSFTGVRIGLATAQGLCLARGLKLVAPSTHEAVAPAEGDSTVIGEAGRGEVYRTRFRDGRALEPPDIVSRDEVGAGNVIDVGAVARTQNVALAAAMLVVRREGPRPAEWSDATPIYVRVSAAEEKLGRIVSS